MSSEKMIGIEEARKVLGDLVTAAQQGTDIILTRGRSHRPVARIVPYKEPAMTTFLATITETRDADNRVTGGTIGVDETRDEAIVASPWQRELTEDEAASRDWDAILADAGWQVVGNWEDHTDTAGYFSAIVAAPVTVDDFRARVGAPASDTSAIIAWLGPAVVDGDIVGAARIVGDLDELVAAWDADEERIEAENA